MDTDDEEIDAGDLPQFPGGTLEDAQAFVQQHLADRIYDRGSL